MSEEEIRDTITKQLKRKADYDTGVHLPQLAVEGLLDLYQQEKEKNEILQKELDNKIKALDRAMSNPDYISKDKIKVKIGELNISDILEDQIAIPYLKELLEEE